VTARSPLLLVSTKNRMKYVKLIKISRLRFEVFRRRKLILYGVSRPNVWVPLSQTAHLSPGEVVLSVPSGSTATWHHNRQHESRSLS
jgi:hypothetical protein